MRRSGEGEASVSSQDPEGLKRSAEFALRNHGTADGRITTALAFRVSSGPTLPKRRRAPKAATDLGADVTPGPALTNDIPFAGSGAFPSFTEGEQGLPAFQSSAPARHAHGM